MPATVLIGLGWGDEGKGRIIDYLAPQHDLVVRFNGGPNAGHTVKVNDRVFKFHLLPSGMLYPDKVCVIANGVVLDVDTMRRELEEVRGAQERHAQLFVSDRCHLILPFHKILDLVEEKARGKRRLGTTGQGIGPVFADKISRKGIRVGDLFHPGTLKEKLENLLQEKNKLLTLVFGENPLDFYEVYEKLLEDGEFLRPFVTDTLLLLQKAYRDGKSILLEGAQGALLDHELGTYPFVTSTSPMAGMVSLGSGLGPHQVDRIIGVVKAYATRVGTGPFPTELVEGIGQYLRDRGGEYGTTTGRPRRCGWFDVPAIKYVIYPNSPDELVITKLDVLSGLEELKICVGYHLEGKEFPGLPAAFEEFEKLEPVYETLPGWKEDISRARRLRDLPREAIGYIKFLEQALEVPISLVSVGPSREQMIEI
ncbi:MAG: adenylosuccinate synthase [Caldiserica bacterium]|jgi:adenylosuccinate synthase|nr:adenylosuccinate synthase [Caldisericota bacterium]MDH7562856.1 adenylosuccinate synthase [Caldisericota bacterium]